MEVQEYVDKMKEFQTSFLGYIEYEDDQYFNSLIFLINNLNLHKNKETLKDILNLISVIGENHHREPNFFKKIIQIMQIILHDIKTHLSNLYIYILFRSNKLFLFYLIQNKIIELDEICKQKILIDRQFGKLQKRHYLYPLIKNNLDEKIKTKIKNEIKSIYNGDAKTFYEYCQIGENENYICSLIRNDSIDDFIIYVNKNNISIANYKIGLSIFETNEFLMNKQPTLIEYAVFYGSIQIFHYLRFSGGKLTSSLWMYAIHGKNPDIIHILEENDIQPNDSTYEECLNESIKCHHNDIAYYIKDNLLQKHFKFKNFNYNYSFLPNFLDNFYSMKIKNYHFNNINFCLSLTKVTIPPNATLINKKTFYGFKSLKNISIPSSVKKICTNAFNECSSIVYLSNEMNVIPKLMFCDSNNLKEIIIPSSITKIQKYSFYYCTSLEKILFPSSVTIIDDHAFNNCTSLKKIEINSLMISLGKYCFFNCISIIELMISSSVTSIGDFAFGQCKSLTQITIHSIEKTGIHVFDKCISISKISIGSSVFSMGSYNFSGFSSIILLDEMKNIPNYMFFDCKTLKKIIIPSSITSIGSSSFGGCISLEEINIPSSVTSIESYSFSRCTSLTKVNIPPLVTIIKSSLFEGCKLLKEVTIPSSVTVIEDYAFCECVSLTKIKIPSSVSSIGDYSFYNCSSLIEISIPSSVFYIGNSSFCGCSSLKQISIPPSIENYTLNQVSDPNHLKIDFTKIGIHKNTKIICELH